MTTPRRFALALWLLASCLSGATPPAVTVYSVPAEMTGRC